MGGISPWQMGGEVRGAAALTLAGGGGAARMCPLHMDRVAAGGRAGAGELVAYAEHRERRVWCLVCACLCGVRVASADGVWR